MGTARKTIFGLVAFGALVCVNSVFAQGTSGTTRGTGTGSSSGGSSFSGFGNSTLGGSSGFGSSSSFGNSTLGGSGFGNSSPGGFGSSSGTGFGSTGTGFGSSPGGTSGSGFPGGTTGGRTGSGTGYPGTSAGISNTNPFASFYANPMVGGLPNGNNSRAAFGSPLYGNTTSSYSTGGMLGGNRSLGGTTGLGGGYPGGAGSATTNRVSPRYVTSLDVSTPPPAPGQGLAFTGRIQTEVGQILARSTALSSGRDIKAALDGPVLVLRGTVADDHDRRIAEGIARLSPGVREVRNELKVQETLPNPAKQP